MDLVSNRWTRKVNFVSKVGRRGRVRETDLSQTCKQLLANEVNTRASHSWRSKCLENWQESAPMSVFCRSSVSLPLAQLSGDAATRVLILRYPVSLARPHSAGHDTQCSQFRRAEAS